MPENKLKPCPFCGSNKVEIENITTDRVAAFCGYCGVVGPHTSLGSAEAIKRWNMRRTDNDRK